MSKGLKFLSLNRYFSVLKDDEITLNFKQIENIIGTELSYSAYKYPEYWSVSKTHTITRCWVENGYKISNLNMKEQRITFKKANSIDIAPLTPVAPRPTSKTKNNQTIKMEEVLLSINKYYAEFELDENARYLSWEHCYKNFQEAYKKPILTEDIIDHLSLHLAFYLASWGMLRGSSFLLQKDYKVHIDVIRELFRPCYNNLWGISYIGLQEQQNLDLLIELIGKMKAIYRIKRENTKVVNTNISDILVTKVLLGTLGCVPAYDEYFKKGVGKYNITTQLLGKSSVRGLVEYYKENDTELENIRKIVSQERNMEYPQMKILDMAFWQLGFDYRET